MKIRDLTILAFALSIIGILVSAIILRQVYFDFTIHGALLMYSIPALILSAANGLILTLFSNYKWVVIVFIPLLLLTGYFLNPDGPFGYIAIFGFIPIVLTNLIWVRSISNKEPTASV